MSIIKRRKFLVGLVLSLFFHRFSNQSVSAQESQSVNIQWRVPAEQVNTVREELNFEGQVIRPLAKVLSRSLYSNIFEDYQLLINN
jgi:hypothetical protein